MADSIDSPRPASPWKRWVLGAALCVAAIVALEGVASLALLAHDIADLQPPPVENFRQAAYDSLLGWVGLPNLAIRDNFGPGLSLTTNADGLRIHRSVSRAASSGERRIICSGASFTFGSGVTDGDTFCAGLERELPGVRTINMAQRGYGIDQSYLYYKRDGALYAHRIELFILNGTDFDRTASSTLNGYPKPTLGISKGVLVPRNVPVPHWTGWSRWEDAKPLLPRLRVMQLLRRQVDVSDRAQYRRIDAQLWPVTDSVFHDLRRLNEQRGSTLAIVYLPSLPEYVPGARDERREKIARSAAQAGARFIDLTPALRAVPRDSIDWLFITPNALPVGGIGGHYNAAGHRWLADRIAGYIRDIPALATAAASPAK